MPLARELREEARLAAQWVLDFAGAAYGPHGSFKLVQAGDGSHALVEGGSGALREARPVDSALAPYLRVVESVQRHGGDQATGALLLAARLVERGMAAVEEGVPVAAVLQGYELALRQARAVLAACARPGTATEALARVSPHAPLWAPGIAAGLLDLVERRHEPTLDLDRIDVRTEPADTEETGAAGPLAHWHEGVVVEPQRAPRSGRFPDARVLVVDDGRLFHSRNEAIVRRLTATADIKASRDAEAADVQAAIAHAQRGGVRLVVCRRSLEDAVADALEAAGILVWTDAPADAVDRVCRATGASVSPGLRHWSSDDLGRGDLHARRRPRQGWLLAGPGAAATLAVPAGTPTLAGLARDEAERLLRAAGCFLADPRLLPGGGRWQRDVQGALLKAAVHAPGKSPLAMDAAADAFGWLADRLVVNAGLDPLDVSLLDDAGEVQDGYRAVRLAVDAAFEAALSVLRIDARHDRRPSRTRDLRGSGRRPGPASGNWMDIPRDQ